jgi:HD-GYP domain-containing protein (c-di-GMP phosphodiesterase class II)
MGPVQGELKMVTVGRADAVLGMSSDMTGVISKARKLSNELSREFTAPCGIVDASRFGWLNSVGGRGVAWPSDLKWLNGASVAPNWRRGRAVVWRGESAGDVIWLVLPIRMAGEGVMLCLLGFWASMELNAAAEHATMASAIDGGEDETVVRGGWGPCCPDAALRAWGQEVVDRFSEPVENGTKPASGGRMDDEESEHVVIGRLIRRLKISDAPQRFQSLATTVLRTSLGVDAVAWVPKEAQESVIVAGEVPGLLPRDYRGMPTSAGPEATVVVRNEALSKTSEGMPSSVKRFASVASGNLGWLMVANPRNDRPIGSSDIERMEYVASLITTQLSNARIYSDLKELLFGVIRALTAAIDAKDPYTCGHSERVARIAVRLAETMGMPSSKQSDLYVAGLLHDVGKIGIDDTVLKKTGPLTPQEFLRIQSHVEIGVNILKDLRKLHHTLPGVKHHHESYDGTGYPDHLSGEDIPLEARILAVADAFDAMSSNRPYRKRLSLMQIDEIFTKGRGVQWDPGVVDALFACRGDLEEIRQKGLGESLNGAVDVALRRG